MEKLEIKRKPAKSAGEREIYRTLRTNIELSGEENRVIAITGCTSGDGKTIVAYNLAVALAESGRRTVLLDADLRNSVLLQRLEVSVQTAGLCQLLSGGAMVGDVVYITNVQNLYLIPSGMRTENSTELLGNERCREAISALRNTYDYIIVDTPPLGNVIDAAVTAKWCDASILVIPSDTLSRTAACNIVSQLRAANSNILGAVLNKGENKSRKRH